MKLKWHLILLVLAAALPLLLFVAAMFSRNLELQRAVLERGMRDTARALSLAVDREIGMSRAILEALAASKHLDERDFAAFYRLCLAVLEPKKGSRIILFDRSGQQLVNTAFAFGAPLPNPLRDAAGAETDPRYPELPLGGPDTVKTVLGAGQSVVSDLFVALSTGQPTVVVGVPVRRGEQVLYALEMTIQAERLVGLLREHGLPSDWFAAIADRRGMIIARKRDPERFLGRPMSPDLGRALGGPEEGWSAGRTLEGLAVYYAFTRSKLTGWTVLIGAPRAAIEGPIKRAALIMAAGAALLLALALGLAVALGRRISVPISKLARSVEAIQRGEPVELEPSAVEEVRRLHAALLQAGTAARAAESEREQRLIAEAKRAEAEEAKRKIGDILESISDGFCAFDREWRFTYFNRRTESEFARWKVGGEDGLLGRVVWDLFPDQVGTPLYESLRRAMNERVPVSCEHFYARAGEWYEVRAYPISDGVGLYWRNITSRKRAQEQLERSIRQQSALGRFLERRHGAGSLEELYEAALDAIVEALRCERASILLFDETGTMRFVAWRGLSEGYRRAVEGHSPWRADERDPEPVCIADVAAAEMEESLRGVLKDEGIGALAFIPLIVDRRLAGKFMTYYDAPHGFTDEELELSLTIARQLALGIERQRDEEALRESEGRLELALAAGGMGAWEWDIRTGRVIWSPSLEEIHGFEPGSFGGRFEDFQREVHPDDLPVVLARIREALESGREYHVEYRSVRRDGRTRWLEAFGRVSFGADGKAERMVGVCMDITARKEAEEKLREADQRKDEFMAMLGHELRNPLGVISTAAQLLRKKGPPDPTTQELREMIERQVEHMARLLDDLLDVSRIARGRIRLERQHCDLVAVLNETVEDYRGALEESCLRLELRIPEGPLPISADRTRLAQAVGNLLHNACKFTDPGGLVSVEASATDEDAWIAVRDSGMGMEPEMLEKVFEPFAQADRTLDRSRGGLGLGLALVKEIVELHGGEVRASSQGLGRGSEFTVRLPLHGKSAARSKTAPQALAGGRSHRILLIEDNPLAARNLKMLLETSGHTAFVAHTGPEGIEVARRIRPEVVLCDIGLPDLDGYEVARRLREEIGLAGSRLIAVSGYAEDEKRAREAGFDAHFTKPVNFEALEAALASLDGPDVREQ